MLMFRMLSNITQGFVRQVNHIFSKGQIIPLLEGRGTLSKVNVSKEGALKMAAFFRGVMLLSGHLATLPLNKFIRTQEGKQVATDDVQRLIKSSPNPFIDPVTFRQTEALYVFLWGNAISIKDRVVNPTRLDLVHPNDVEGIFKKDGEIFYKISKKGKVHWTRIHHVKGLGLDPFWGKSIIQYAREDIGLGLAMRNTGSTFFGNSAFPSTVVSFKRPINKEQAKEYKEGWIKQFSGDNKSQVAVIGDDATIQPLSMPLKDFEFMAGRNFQVNEIARFLGTPPQKLYELSRQNFSNIQELNLDYLIDTLMFWLAKFEAAYNFSLLRPSEKDGSAFFKYNEKALLRMNSEKQAEFVSKLLDRGVFNINDVRSEIFDMNTIGEQGDRRYINSTNVPLDRIDDIINAKQGIQNQDRKTEEDILQLLNVESNGKH